MERGEYPAGSVLPSENELAAEFHTTRLTVRNAVDDLVARGMVRRVQGKGAFVAPRAYDRAKTVSGGFREIARALGREPSVRIISRGFRKAGDYYAWVLGIGPDDVLYSLRRVNSLDGHPVSLESTLIPLKLFEGIEDVDIQVYSLYETYALLGHQVAAAQEKLDLTQLTPRDAGLLRVDAGDPALDLKCVSYDAAGQPLEYAHSLSRADFAGYIYRD